VAQTYDDYGDGFGYAPVQRQRGTKIRISNLGFDVVDQDIIDLFGDAEIGPIISAGVSYDRSGRSTGMAEVVYQRAQDAQTAIRKYNDVPLDGFNMVIELVQSAAPIANAFGLVNRPARAQGGLRIARGGIRKAARGGAASFKSIVGNAGGIRIKPATKAKAGRGGKAAKPGGRGAKKAAATPKAAVDADMLDKDLEEYKSAKPA